MLVSWHWLQEYLGKTEITAKEAADLLGVHAFEIEDVQEREGDTIIDVDVLPNRSSDCLCHRGIARELASITQIPLAHDPLREPVTLTGLSTIDIQVKEPKACPRFAASLITGITVKESPQWLQTRLKAIGQRPINNIVDATNYVMFALGQPIHAYDADLFPQVAGTWKFEVRFADAGETVSLIPEAGKEEERVVTCEGTELLIVDGSSQTPIGLAGVKGGSFAGVHSGTTQVIIETAHFHPTITRKTARRLGIVIDASKRFENEPSRELIPYAQQMVRDLIVQIAGGTYVGTVDEYLESVSPKEVFVSLNRINALLGLTLTATEVQNLLERIGATVEKNDGGFLVTGPWERTDLLLEVDFIEEVGRLHGYGYIASITPTPLPLEAINKRHYYCELIRKTLLEEGFSEVITSSFRSKDEVQLKNALASDKSCLRSNLATNITEVLDKNAGFVDLLGNSDTRVFEIGTVFYKDNNQVTEHSALALGVRIKSSGYSGKEDKILKSTSDALSVALGVSCQFAGDKGVVEINVTELLKTLPDPTSYEPIEIEEEVIAYQPFSVYQHMTRDIAMWVKAGTTAEQVETILNQNAGPLRIRTTLFDEFTKDEKTSFAFRLVFQSKERTLTDEEVNNVMDSIYKAVEKEGWEVR